MALNAQQQEVVNHGDGPLLIIAGAGTGKTTVVTERVKHLITQRLARPQEILSLTFTEKAAREMEERIDVAMPYGYTQMWTMTFHSFCDRILRDEALAVGLDTGYKLLSEADSVDLLRRHIFDFDLDYYRPLGNPTKFVAALLQHFSRLQDEDVTPESYQKWSQGKESQYQELAQLYVDYTELKAKEGVLDFGDLVTYTLLLFRTRPQVLESYREKFKYILVDEFQDTNYAQNQLVNLLAGEKQNLTVVADDDQAIYRWRGAAVSNVIQFRKTYPTTKLVVLSQNYRSSQEILDKSYQLIQNNNPDRLEVTEKINKKLRGVRKVSGEKIEFIHASRVEDEADLVAKEIARLKTIDSSLGYRDFAILVRANAHAEPFLRSLTHYNIPHQFLGPAQLFKQPEIKDLIAYLQFLSDPGDNNALYRVLSMEIFGISTLDLLTITGDAKRNNKSLFGFCKENVENEKIKPVIDLLSRHIDLSRNQTAGQVLFSFLEESGLLRQILNLTPPFNERMVDNIMRFFNKLKAYESSHEDSLTRAVVDWLRLAIDLGESPLAADSDWSQNDAVNILTIHSAKGLEFPVVFLVNLVSQRFPSTERHESIPVPDELIKEILPEGDFHLQEERRLFYVGMTRARDRLYLTAADYYGEGKREKKISPFVGEALGEVATTPVAQVLQPSLLDWRASVVSAGPSDLPVKPVTYLSYSQIQTFLDCPFHYKAKYILKLPTPPSAASSFGNTVHATLKEFYTLKGQKDIVTLLQKNWTSQGYTDKKQEQLYLDRGKVYLSDYVAKEFDPKLIPLKLEEPFTVPMSSTLKIGGKIDRVDVLADGIIEIIDYKTSTKMLTQKEADNDLQLSFYALAATSIPELPFAKKPDQIKLSLYYFEDQKKVTTTRTSEALEMARSKIFEYAEQIAHSNFRCSGSIVCQHCDFQILCDMVRG